MNNPFKISLLIVPVCLAFCDVCDGRSTVSTVMFVMGCWSQCSQEGWGKTTFISSLSPRNWFPQAINLGSGRSAFVCGTVFYLSFYRYLLFCPWSAWRHNVIWWRCWIMDAKRKEDATGFKTQVGGIPCSQHLSLCLYNRGFLFRICLLCLSTNGGLNLVYIPL